MKVELDWLKQYVDLEMSKEALCHLLTMGGLEIEADEPVEVGGGRLTDVLELNVTPNRGYCLSHLGVAREIAAMTGKPFHPPDPEPRLQEAFAAKNSGDRLTVVNEEDALCPRYTALVIDNVHPAPSPSWLQERLLAIGLRPINNIVDVTNFVMMEYGQPLHAFDLDLLSGARIVIRRAQKGEPFKALDGTELKLDTDALVIADAEKPVALAGIMGGSNSQVTLATRAVALESAYFDPTCVRRASKRYGLRSDSSYRFERGVDIEGVITAQSRAALLIQELAGGEILQGRFDLYPHPQEPARIGFRISRTNQVLGTGLASATILGYLKALGLRVIQEVKEEEEYLLEAPSFRPTLRREIDLIEEVARLHGYDHVAVTRPVASLNPVRRTPVQEVVRKARELLSHLGYNEAVNFSFIEQDHAAAFKTAFAPEDAACIDLDNPISADLRTMRTSLLPGLVKAAVTNINKGQKSVRLFEEGGVFHQAQGADAATQIPCIAVLAAGPHAPSVWKATGQLHDYYDLKGVLESVLQRFGVEVEYRRAGLPYLAADQSTACYAGNLRVAYCGRLDPKQAAKMGLDTPAYGMELHLANLAAAMPARKRFQPLPRFPETYRDISILVDKPVESGHVRELIRRAGEPLLSRVDLYDQFEGKKLPEGKKSLTYALAFQSPDKTLTDEEVNPVFDRIVRTLGDEVGASLRDA